MRQYILSISLLLGICSILNGQCYPERHSTNWFDGWVSCDAAPIPNGGQEKGHWIMYDFGKVFKLGQMTVWNTNDPSHLDWGMRDALIEVSTDGQVWTSAGTHTFLQATGQSIYEGTDGPDLGGVEARYVLITAQSNYGGECYGLSEIRIEAEETVVSAVKDLAENDCFSLSASPNPFVTDSEIEIISTCPEPFMYSLVNVLGIEVRHGESAGSLGTIKVRLAMQDLPQGTYFLRVYQEEKTAQMTLVKFNRS